MMFRLWLLSLFGFHSLLIAKTLHLAVAANMSYAVNDLTQIFHKHYPGYQIRTTIGSSGKLRAQIEHGAHYDIFMSANMDYPQSLYEKGKTVAKPKVYAQGLLAFFSAEHQNLASGIELLTSDQIKRVAIANPKTAPYGKAALQALENAKILDAVKSKLIYAESISQTLSYAMIAADIGLIATSALHTPKMAHYKEGVHYQQINPKLYDPIQQGIVILKSTQNLKAAQAFYDFVLSKESDAIFQSYGYKR